MPRPSKAAKSESHPERLEIDYLRTLTRAQIQGLAKNHGVKANQKTEKMVTEILAKQGSKDDRNSSVAPSKRSKATKETDEKESKDSTESVKLHGESSATNVIEPSEQAPSPTPKTPNRKEKGLAPDQLSKETKAPKRSKRGRRVAPPLPSSQTAEMENHRPLVSNEEHADAEGPRVLRHDVPNSIVETPTSSRVDETANVGQQTSCRISPVPNINRRPTVQDIRDLRKLVADLTKERTRMQSELSETKASLSYAMDTLERGTELLKEMTFKRQLYERHIVDEILKTDDLEGMTPEDRKKWLECLERNGLSSRAHESRNPSRHAAAVEDADDDDMYIAG